MSCSAGAPCGASCFLLRLSGTDRVAVVVRSALPHAANSPIQGTSSTFCLSGVLISSLSFVCWWSGVLECLEGELLTCILKARFLLAWGEQGNE